MTKFVFGGVEVDVPILCLEAAMLAGELLPAAKALAETDPKAAQRASFEAFIKILVCNLEPEDPATPAIWTERKILRTVKGQGEMDLLSERMQDLFRESGFVPQEAPAPGADLPPTSDQPAQPTPADSSKESSSVSPATA